MTVQDGEAAPRTKMVKAVLADSVHLTAAQAELCVWLKEQTLCTFAEALSAVIPSGTALKRTLRWQCVDEGLAPSEKVEELRMALAAVGGIVEKLTQEQRKAGLALKRKGLILEDERFEAEIREKVQAFIEPLGTEADLAGAFARKPARMDAYVEILRFLNLVGSVSTTEIQSALGVSPQLLKTLEEKKLIRRIHERVERLPSVLGTGGSEGFLPLNEEQQKVFNQMSADFPKRETWLLHGVTGSGKTELYLHLCRVALEKGTQALILVPEIALTPQIVSRFALRFGRKVAVLHSRLSPGERYDQWRRIREGEADVVVGPRSALFAPLKNPGLIVLDEEHEGAYKSESAPRYHARDVAAYLADRNDALLILGSATPSVESFYRASKGIYKLGVLNRRANESAMPPIRCIDMRDELLSGNRGIISRVLLDGIADRLERKEQVLLFLNRKGYATFINCKSCGFVLRCPRCEIALTYYKGGGHARCGYCGHAAPVTAKCPECSSEDYQQFGQGTERLEESLNAMWPNARIARLDAESTSKKGTLEDVIHRVETGQVDILVGTQMLAKGLHFPNITLVGILTADQPLNFPDYRANERAFQLLTQVSGRTGRGDRPGEVIIQTYRPDHYAIDSAANHDYHGFYASEIKLRKAFRYPPFVELVNLIVQGDTEETVLKWTKELYNTIGQHLKKLGLTFQMLGPHPAAMARIRGQYRYQIFLKYLGSGEPMVLEALREILPKLQESAPSDIRLTADIRPVTTL